MSKRNLFKIFAAAVILITLAVPSFSQRTGSLTGPGSNSGTNPTSSKVSLTVQCNVRNANVQISSVYRREDDRPVFSGTAPFTAQLDKGSYTVTVSAPGYRSVSQDVRLSSTQTISINLNADSQYLTVTSNVSGASVLIRGSGLNGTISGSTNFRTELQPGSYKVRVSAPGYSDMDKDINFSGSTTLDFQLRPKSAQLEIVIPNSMLDYSGSNPAGRIQIYDNGSLISGNLIQLSPGQHTIRIVSGGLAAQQTINVRAGENYRFEVNFGLSVFRQ